jgi:RNA polymerase sigma-70 factor (sigma-E family)
VGALYQESAAQLIRLAYVILSDRQAAEDVVQEAFYHLYRRWDRLADSTKASMSVRTSVLNGCRSALRHRAVRGRRVLYELPAASAEAMALGQEEYQDVIRAIDLLPGRQREAVVLRFYLNLTDEQIAELMGVRPSTVRSTTHRALESLSRTLKEMS